MAESHQSKRGFFGKREVLKLIWNFTLPMHVIRNYVLEP